MITIPAHIATLLVSYFCQTTTMQQAKQLDEWICANDDNMKIFEDCMERSLLPVTSDPDRQEEITTLSFQLN